MPVEEMVAAETEASEPATPARQPRPFHAGDKAIQGYLREIDKLEPLTPQAEVELAARLKKGDPQAREQLIKANLPLVSRIARDFEGIGLPLLDLISEGNIGLLKAVERFDPAQGCGLSTYISSWIKHSIENALASRSETIPWFGTGGKTPR
jgi:RNA polymerase primary sigma factor